MADSPITGAPNDARQFAVEQARAQLKRLSAPISRAAKSCSAGAVHDVRVAIRRFSQAAAVCRRYFHAANSRKNRKHLKNIMAGAGEVRNRDVALKFIDKYRTPHAVELRSRLQTDRQECARMFLNELSKWTDRRMFVQLRAALDSAEDEFAGQPVDALAHRALGRIAKDFLKRGEEVSSPEASPALLHQFRITTKKFRYALELFQPAYKPALDPLVESIKRTASVLGDINDCVTVAGMMKDYPGGKQLADRLKKRQHKKTEEFRKFWKEEFSDGEWVRTTIHQLTSAAAAQKADSEQPRRLAPYIRSLAGYPGTTPLLPPNRRSRVDSSRPARRNIARQSRYESHR